MDFVKNSESPEQVPVPPAWCGCVSFPSSLCSVWFRVGSVAWFPHSPPCRMVWVWVLFSSCVCGSAWDPCDSPQTDSAWRGWVVGGRGKTKEGGGGRRTHPELGSSLNSSLKQQHPEQKVPKRDPNSENGLILETHPTPE